VHVIEVKENIVCKVNKECKEHKDNKENKEQIEFGACNRNYACLD